MAGTKLGILLTTSPESQDMHTVMGIAEAAIAQGKSVQIFVMCDGVGVANCDNFLELIPKGVQVSMCHNNAHERKIHEEGCAIKSASQYIFSGIISDVDRLITFC